MLLVSTLEKDAMEIGRNCHVLVSYKRFPDPALRDGHSRLVEPASSAALMTINRYDVD